MGWRERFEKMGYEIEVDDRDTKIITDAKSAGTTTTIQIDKDSKGVLINISQGKHDIYLNDNELIAIACCIKEMKGE